MLVLHMKIFASLSSDQNIYIILEYCEYGSLLDLQRKKKIFLEQEIKLYLKKLICGLKFTL